MSLYLLFSLILFVSGAAVAVLLLFKLRRTVECDSAWSWLASRTRWQAPPFGEVVTAHLPPAARAYFRFSIPAGTPLCAVAEIRAVTQTGGEHDRAEPFQEIVAAPYGICWRWRSACRRFGSGFVALVDAGRFHADWLLGFIPAGWSRKRATAEMLFARLCLDSLLWCPAALLLDDGVTWEHLGEDRCRIRIRWRANVQLLELQVAQDGSPLEVRLLGADPSRPLAIARPSDFRVFSGHRLAGRLLFAAGPESPNVFRRTALRSIRFRERWLEGSHA